MNGRWLAWTVLFGVVLGAVTLSVMFVRSASRPAGPTTQVEGKTGWPRTLVERFPDGSEGRRVVLKAPPQRIASVTLATDEILMDLIGPERIVALSYLAPKQVSMIADRVGPLKQLAGADVESIIALQPDLCFLASYNREETRSLLVESGVPVYVFQSFDSLQDIRHNIRTVGLAVGAEKEAEGLIATMDRKIANVARQLPSRSEWPSALVYASSGRIAGAGTMQTEVFHAAGVRNAAVEAGVTRFAQVSEEEVLAMDPDYLVLAEGSIGMARQKQWLLDNPALAPLKAIRGERFLVLDEAMLSTVSHYIADTVVHLARQAHRGRFPDDQQ